MISTWKSMPNELLLGNMKLTQLKISLSTLGSKIIRAFRIILATIFGFDQQYLSPLVGRRS